MVPAPGLGKRFERCPLRHANQSANRVGIPLLHVEDCAGSAGPVFSPGARVKHPHARMLGFCACACKGQRTNRTNAGFWDRERIANLIEPAVSALPRRSLRSRLVAGGNGLDLPARPSRGSVVGRVHRPLQRDTLRQARRLLHSGRAVEHAKPAEPVVSIPAPAVSRRAPAEHGSVERFVSGESHLCDVRCAGAPGRPPPVGGLRLERRPERPNRLDGLGLRRRLRGGPSLCKRVGSATKGPSD